jgi:hypothetical protein
MIKETKGKLMPHQMNYQVENIIKITTETKRGKRLGFTLGSEHIIVEPPDKEYPNCNGYVWVKDSNQKYFCLPFYCYKWLGKVADTTKLVKRVRKNTVNILKNHTKTKRIRLKS